MQKWAIIGLGNPGTKFERTRHNIGFRVVDLLADQYASTRWKEREHAQIAEGTIDSVSCYFIKPMTFMNNSGKVMPYLQAQGIPPEQTIVIHDELELPFGRCKQKYGTSAKGHNGLRSIIGVVGKNFYRIACGIGRPEEREQVPSYVLAPFTEASNEVEQMITEAAQAAIACIALHSQPTG